MKMRSPCKRLLLLLAAFSALAAHVAADCRGTAACPQSSGCSNPPPFPAAGPFPGSAYRHSCLANASLPCSSPANANCCSCGIYNRYCATASPGLNFVTNGNNLTTDNHALVLPRTPCAGVESWTHKSCGREGIWDAAVDLMLARDGTYGAAVNSVGRRGAHQLHVHVGKVWTTLTSALPKQPGTTMQLSCSKTPNRNLNCKRGTSLDYQLTATVVTADKPRHANAFKAAYGAPPSSSAITTTLLVVPLDLNNYALVTTTDVPAECLLHGQDFVCY